jgi:hypothetical protein
VFGQGRSIGNKQILLFDNVTIAEKRLIMKVTKAEAQTRN